MSEKQNKFRCIIHGSFRKHFDLIKSVHKIFSQAGIEVIAPKDSEIVGIENGFIFLDGEETTDKRLLELQYLHNLKKLGSEGFSYFVNPEGYVGKTTSYELGIAQLTNIQCFFLNNLKDHPAYLHKNSIWNAEELVEFIKNFDRLPEPKIRKNERVIHNLWEDLMVPGSVVAVGGIIEYQPSKTTTEKEVLLVKTHKWGGRYSIVGGKVRRNERLFEGLLREVKEETGLRADVGEHLATFDQIKNSGYYQRGVQHIFVDNVVKVSSKRVLLNEEAQDFVWSPVGTALKELDIEPNARHTLELYNGRNKKAT